MELNFRPIFENFPYLLEGVKNTLLISVLALCFSFILGVFLAFLTQSRFKIVSFLAFSYIEFFRNTPVLAQLFFWYFGLTVIGFELSPLQSSVIALSLSAAAVNAESIRSGMMSIQKGIREASASLGLSKMGTNFYIILPIALKVSFKPLSSNFINLILTTSVTMSVTADELMSRIATLQANHESSTFEVYLTALIMFGILTTILSFTTKAIDYYWVSKEYQKTKANKMQLKGNGS